MNAPLLTIGFFQNIGMPELIFVFVIVLIIFGPKSLPALGRALGQGIREFKGASSKLSNALDEAVREEDKDQPKKSETRQIAPDNVYTAPAAPKNTIATSPHSTPAEEKG